MDPSSATPRDRGKEVEEVVEKICNKMFLPDLTIANPKFKNGRKLEKEVADIIIPFRDNLICFQIKSKTELKPASEKNETDFERINRRIEDGIGQLKMIRVCLRRGLISELENGRGLALPIDCAEIKKVYGVVILELLGEENFPEHERTSIFNGFDVRDGMPIHVFKLDAFDVIASEIDTIPDFVDYLEVRERLISTGQLHSFTQELDFLAVYKTKQNIFDGLRDGTITHLFLEDGLWKAHAQINAEAIRQRNEANAPSYLWDEMLKTLHLSLGFEPNFQPPSSRNLFQQGTVANYFAASLELSTMRRIERRAVGAKLVEVLSKADVKGNAYAFIGSANDKGPHVVLYSSSDARPERAKALFTYCSIFYCGMNLKKIVGIATEPGSHIQRSHDIVCLNEVEFENVEEIRAQFAKWNPKINHTTVKEYGVLDKKP